MHRVRHALHVSLHLLTVAPFLAGAVGQGLRACPYHAIHGGEHAGHAGRAEPAGDGHAGHGTRPAGQSESPRAPCSCIGTCHLQSAVPLARGRETGALDGPAAVRLAAPLQPERATGSSARYLHPARAPPLSA